MHYTANIYEAFDSVEHIMRDVNNGWFIRYCHANTASAFFVLVYLHISRGIYYGSYRAPRTIVWSIGVIILILMMATAFLGYIRSPKWYILNKIFNKNNNKNKNKNESICMLNNKSLDNYLNYNNVKNKFNNGKNKNKRLYSTRCEISSLINTNKVNKFIKEKNLKPVFVYEDLSVNSIRTKVLNETRNLSGIYLILNKDTLDYYVGSASTGKLYSRFSNHLFNFNGSKLVKDAVKKYGISSFAFMVLELFPEVVTKENNKKLLDLEDFYLKSLIPNYNILTEAGSSFGYKHTEITRIKMKAIYNKKRRLKITNLNKDKTLSSETNKILKKKSKALIVYNLDSTVFGEYSSIIEASKSLGCDKKTIRRALKTSKKILKRCWIVKLV